MGGWDVPNTCESCAMVKFCGKFSWSAVMFLSVQLQLAMQPVSAKQPELSADYMASTFLRAYHAPASQISEMMISYWSVSISDLCIRVERRQAPRQ